MLVIYRHQRAPLGRCLHHHRPEMNAACVNFGLLRVCQKKKKKNGQESPIITKNYMEQQTGLGKQVLLWVRQATTISHTGWMDTGSGYES